MGRCIVTPARLRAVSDLELLQAYLDGDGCKGAARILGLPEGTVRRRLMNARSRHGVRTTAQLVLLHARQLRKRTFVA